MRKPNEKIEELRQKLNEMIVTYNYDEKELQSLSEELDVLIVKEMKDKQKEEILKTTHISVEELEELLKGMHLFRKMYQYIRIVDPVNKKIINFSNGTIKETEISCYKYWKRNKMCDNCISIRAYKENDAIFKLEIKEDKVYMIMAVPIVIKDKKFVLEMLKSTTDTLLIEDNINSNNKKLCSLIDYLNQGIKKYK